MAYIDGLQLADSNFRAKVHRSCRFHFTSYPPDYHNSGLGCSPPNDINSGKVVSVNGKKVLSGRMEGLPSKRTFIPIIR